MLHNTADLHLHIQMIVVSQKHLGRTDNVLKSTTVMEVVSSVPGPCEIKGREH